MAIIRVLAWANAVVAIAAGTYGFYNVGLFFNPPESDSHGGQLALFSGLIFIAFSGLLMLVSQSFRKNWKVKWALQCLPILAASFFVFT